MTQPNTTRLPKSKLDAPLVSRVIPSQDYLRQILDYDTTTGALTWKHRDDMELRWNSRWAGRPAFDTTDIRGYKTGRICGRRFYAHRIIYKWVHGVNPDVIDHANGNTSDNRISNLRSVSQAENRRNARRPSNNTSGAVGVHWCTKQGVWYAQIQVFGKVHFIGHFTDFSEAVLARKHAERKFDFHENHGAAS